MDFLFKDDAKFKENINNEYQILYDDLNLIEYFKYNQVNKFF